MSNDVLVLNKNFYAIQIINWQKAMSLLWQSQADALDESLQAYDFNTWKELSQQMAAHPNGFVNTVNFKIAIPEVIKLTKYDRLPKHEVKFTRKNIYQHYGFKCCYCGGKFKTENLNLDHVIPRSKGGPTDWTNIVTACIPCNSKKGDKTPNEVGMKLLVQPNKPKWKGAKSLLCHGNVSPVRTMWQRLIDHKYWSGELDS